MGSLTCSPRTGTPGGVTPWTEPQEEALYIFILLSACWAPLPVGQGKGVATGHRVACGVSGVGKGGQCPWRTDRKHQAVCCKQGARPVLGSDKLSSTGVSPQVCVTLMSQAHLAALSAGFLLSSLINGCLFICIYEKILPCNIC